MQYEYCSIYLENLQSFGSSSIEAQDFLLPFVSAHYLHANQVPNTTNKQVDTETCYLIEIYFWPKPTICAIFLNEKLLELLKSTKNYLSNFK